MKKLNVLLFITAVVLSTSTTTYAASIPYRTIKASLQNTVNTLFPKPLKTPNVSIEDLCKKFNIDITTAKENCFIKDIPNIDCPFDKPILPAFTLPEISKTETLDPKLPKYNTPQSNNVLTTEVVRLVNKERKQAGLAPLAVDSSIEAAAHIRAKEQQASFSHTRPNGTHFKTVLKEQGISYQHTGENIAFGQTTPNEVVNDWMNSPEHRANILSETYTTIGVGYHKGANDTPYWTQLFIES